MIREQERIEKLEKIKRANQKAKEEHAERLR